MIDRLLVDSGFGRMHLRRSQGRGRPLVALHMSPLSGRMFLPLMERLARPVIAPDRLGFGFSDPPPSGLDMDGYAAASLAALDAAGVGGFDVIGEHTGSVEAVAMAAAAPDRIGRVGLVALPVYTDEELQQRAGTRGAPTPEPREDGGHLLVPWRRRLSYRKAPYDLALMHRHTVDELLCAGPHLAYRAVFAYPMAARLAAVTHPLVVFAPHDDLIEQTERGRRSLPGHAVYVDLPDLGLDIFDTAADRMAQLVTNHLGDGT